MQNIEDLLKTEVQYALDKNRAARRTTRNQNRMTVNEPDFGGNSNPSSMAPSNPLDSPALKSKSEVKDNKMSKFNQIGASSTQRWFTKTRMNETMTRELISWLGLLS